MGDFVEQPVAPDNSGVPKMQSFSELSVGGGPTKFLVTKRGLSVGNILIADEYGLNSSNNFRADSISGTGPITTTSDSMVDVTGSTMTSFVLARPAVVSISFTVYGYNSRYTDTNGQEVSEMTAQLVDSVDGVVEAAFLTGVPYVLLDGFLYPGAMGVYPSFYSSTTNALLSAGTHTLKLQFRRENSVGTATIDSFGISYSILGI
jgi:hypothetical protein